MTKVLVIEPDMSVKTVEVPGKRPPAKYDTVDRTQDDMAERAMAAGTRLAWNTAPAPREIISYDLVELKDNVGQTYWVYLRRR